MQLALVLGSNKLQAWTYDIGRNIFSLLSSKGSATEYTPYDFVQDFYDHDDFSEFRNKLLFAVRDGYQQSGNFVVRGKQPSDGSRQRIYEFHLSILHHDWHNHPTVLLGIQRDITDARQHREEAGKLALRYHTVFNSSLIDMIYYDADGILRDINDKACDTFLVSDKEHLLAAESNIKDVPALKGIDFRTIDRLHSSSITSVADIDKPIGDKNDALLNKKKTYYEQIISPVHDADGKLTGIVMAGRNITEMVESQHYQKQISQELVQTTKNIQEYTGNINYTLRVSGVRLVKYNPFTHELEISSDLNTTELRLSQVRCISLVQEADRRRARGLFLRMDHLRQSTFTQVFHTRLRDKHRHDIYLTFSLVPIYDKHGAITHYFGMCRDDSEMVYTEAQLRQETEKAQETEELKNSFLTNMSYEIRTPLNAVLGFANLYSNPHDEADEPVFAEEIKRNTNSLLQLVNDILYISRLDAKMEEFKYTTCDFASLFEGFCYMGWASLHPGVTVSVDNPYSSLVVTIDESHLGQILQKLCSFAAKYTTEGRIHAKYQYSHGELSIAIEDTGQGMSAELSRHIFERFATNKMGNGVSTGLEMPIIKALIEQMGGSIEIQSEEKKGTTVYLVIPCEMTAMEKKLEII